MKLKELIKICLLVQFFIVSFCFAEQQGQEEEDKAFTFVQISDTQLGEGDFYYGQGHDVNLFRKTVEYINELKPDFVVHCGDMVDIFTEESIKDFNDVKSKLTVPFYVAPGNHEMYYQPNPERLAWYRALYGKDYFSFKHKGFTFVIVNSQLWKSPLAGETEKMDAWFRSTLREARDANSPIFVVQHIPFFMKEPNEPEDPDYNLPVRKRIQLLALMKQYGVVAVLNGHKHMQIINDYEGIKLVTCSSLSKNDDDNPLGFMVWHVELPKSIKYEFVPMETPPKEPTIDLNSLILGM